MGKSRKKLFQHAVWGRRFSPVGRILHKTREIKRDSSPVCGEVCTRFETSPSAAGVKPSQAQMPFKWNSVGRFAVLRLAKGRVRDGMQGTLCLDCQPAVRAEVGSNTSQPLPREYLATLKKDAPSR